MQGEDKLPITVLAMEKIELVGLCIRTTIQDAFKDCPPFWEQDFMPRLSEITGKPISAFQGITYGISVMVGNEGAIDYCAAVSLATGMSMPLGMRSITLQGGLYAHCKVTSLALLGAAYDEIYSQWPSKQSEYVPMMQSPCFERYDEQFIKNGSFELFVPVFKA